MSKGIAQDHCKAAYLYRGNKSGQTLTAKLMNKLATDTIPDNPSKPTAEAKALPPKDEQAIRSLTVGQVLHFIDAGESKLSTDPRHILMRFIKESVVHYKKWTNPKADDAYTITEIHDRATKTTDTIHSEPCTQKP